MPVPILPLVYNTEDCEQNVKSCSLNLAPLILLFHFSITDHYGKAKIEKLMGNLTFSCLEPRFETCY